MYYYGSDFINQVIASYFLWSRWLIMGLRWKQVFTPYYRLVSITFLKKTVIVEITKTS